MIGANDEGQRLANADLERIAGFQIAGYLNRDQQHPNRNREPEHLHYRQERECVVPRNGSSRGQSAIY